MLQANDKGQEDFTQSPNNGIGVDDGFPEKALSLEKSLELVWNFAGG